MELSKRLEAVAGLVTPGNRLADVGTDHGYIPIYLLEAGIVPCAIAMDVNKGPLQQAMEHIKRDGLEGKIVTRLSDGMKELEPGEVDTVVIAGMGGALTLRILEESRGVLESLKELVLQPQSEIARVRRWLAENGFRIAAEDMILEDGKYYPMMRVIQKEPGEVPLNASENGEKDRGFSQMEALYGPILLKEKHPCLKEYLQWERQIKEKVLEQLKNAGDGAAKRREEVQEALRWNAQALSAVQ